MRDQNGDVIIYANGNYYEGSKRGIDYSCQYGQLYGGKRTGGVIKSRNAFGPGSFEVLMKIPSVSGVCTSIWLYNYFGDGNNHEIDIELHGTVRSANGNRSGQTNLSAVLCSSWLTESDVTSLNAPVGKPLADGKFHSFRFDWHTGNDPRVEYYVDGVLVMTIRDNVPTNKMYFNIGCWFPNGWCGVPDFETDALVVRSFKYTAFGGESAGSENSATISTGASIRNGQIEQTNLLANGNFDTSRKQFVWQIDGTFTDGVLDGSLSQVLNFDAEKVEYLLQLQGEGDFTVTVEYSSFVSDVTVSGSQQFTLHGGESVTFTPPEGCTSLTVTISGSGATLTSATLAVKA